MGLEIDNDKILITGNNSSGKTELALEMAYNSLRLGARITYIADDVKVDNIKERFMYHDKIKELNIVDDFSMLKIISCSNFNTENLIGSSDIYVLDLTKNEKYLTILNTIIRYEESTQGKGMKNVGILCILPKKISLGDESINSEDDLYLSRLFERVIVISSSILVGNEEFSTYMVSDYIMDIVDVDFKSLKSSDKKIPLKTLIYK